jgi:hypothetical protein
VVGGEERFETATVQNGQVAFEVMAAEALLVYLQ